MRIQLARGNIHREIWSDHNIFDLPGDEHESLAYTAVLAKHSFLADVPHYWEAGEREIEWGGTKSKFCSVRIYRDEAMQDYWFGVQYRVLDGAVKQEGQADE